MAITNFMLRNRVSATPTVTHLRVYCEAFTMAKLLHLLQSFILLSAAFQAARAQTYAEKSESIVNSRE